MNMEGRIEHRAGPLPPLRDGWIERVAARFELRGEPRLIGEGSTCRVYKCAVGEAMAPRALKALPISVAPSMPRRVFDEITAHIALTGCENVVQLFDCEVNPADGEVFLLEELCAPLHEYRRAYPLNAPEVFRLGIQICDALEQCRERGVAHLDVQPRNIFLGADGRYKLGDFGCALRLSRLPGEKILRGTLAYMAPEVHSRREYSVRSDLYSLALVLYCLFNGNRLPFTDEFDSDEAIRHRLDGAALPPVRGAVDAFNAQLSRALNPDPAARFASPAEMRDWLRRCMFEAMDEAVDSGESSRPLAEGEPTVTQREDSWDVPEEEDFPGCTENRADFDALDSATTEPFREFDAEPFAASAAREDFDADPFASSADPRIRAFDAGSSTSSMSQSLQGPEVDAPLAARAPGASRSKPPLPPAAAYAMPTQYGIAIPQTGIAQLSAAALALGKKLRDRRHRGDAKVGESRTAAAAQVEHCATERAASPTSVERPVAPAAEQAVSSVDEPVQFSVVAPKRFQRDAYTMLDVFMYEDAARAVVEQALAEGGGEMAESRSGRLLAAVGTRVRVVLTSPDLALADCEESGVWVGDHLRFSFAVWLPGEFAKTQMLFNALIYFDGVLVTRLKFIASCFSAAEQRPEVVRQDIRSAFISYSSHDRGQVASVVQGMQKVRPDMDIFWDLDSLHSGDYWDEAIKREIDARDVLYLCWSHHARESKHVEEEWRYALNRKGLSFIEPIPFEPSELCPPPEELASKHFNDRLLYFTLPSRGFAP